MDGAEKYRAVALLLLGREELWVCQHSVVGEAGGGRARDRAGQGLFSVLPPATAGNPEWG